MCNEALKDMIWEVYDDQSTEDFDFIGIRGSENIEPLTDIDAQVSELIRLHGSNVEILLYKEAEVTV